jgi:diguanylate cyclase (GGDEF)-like protein
MPETNAERAFILAQRLQEVIATRRFAIGGVGDPVKLGVSLGVAVFPADAERPERLLWCADMALLESKRRGGGQVVFYDVMLKSRIREPLKGKDDQSGR